MSEEALEKQRQWHRSRREENRAYEKMRYDTDPEYRRKRLASTMARHKRVSKHTPPWADLEAITQFYMNRPDGYHVDHIVPLRGEMVSGLHVLENLQYLTKSENCSKRNKFTEEN